MIFSRSSVLHRQRLGCVALALAFHSVVAWTLVRGAVHPEPAPEKPMAFKVSLIVPAPAPPALAQPALPARSQPQRVLHAPAARAQPSAPRAPAVAPPSVVAPSPVEATVGLDGTDLAPPAAGPATIPVAGSSAGVAAAPASASVNQAIGVVCPVQVKPVMPSRALREGVEGSVTARLTVRAGKVIQVDIMQAQPRGVFESAVRHAVQQYRCESEGDVDVLATQVFAFKFD